jgi:hypothetical protein
MILALLLAAAFTLAAPPVLKAVDDGWFAAPAGASPALMGRHAALPRFIFGRLKCAANVNAWLRLHGKRGTSSASSRSFLSFPRVGTPRPGDIRFNYRPGGGGHAAVYAGQGMCLNPSQNKGWRRVPCARIWHGRRAIYVRPR